MKKIKDILNLKYITDISYRQISRAVNIPRFKNWAASVDGNAGTFVQQRLETAEYPTNTYRGIISILSLEKIYGKIALNLALGYASSINTTSVKSIRSILDKKLYLQVVNNHTVKPTTPTHENIRGSEYYK